MKDSTYFCSQGFVYLHVDKADMEKSSQEVWPEEIDPAMLKILNWRKRIEYENPEDESYYEQLSSILVALYWQTRKPKTNRLEKKSVVISGSGIDFNSSEAYTKGERLICHIGFPGYPFEMVRVAGKVASCAKDVKKGWKVSVLFKDVSEVDQEILIKFVNFLQRDKLTKTMERKL